MVHHNENIWEVNDELSEIQRKIVLLMAEGTPAQRAVLIDAQRELAQWELTYAHKIRKMFEI